MMRKTLLTFLAALGLVTSVAAQSPSQPRGFDDSASNLMVVLRESQGANKQDETLVPMSRATVTLPDGRKIDVDTGFFDYLGDMHIRFVFDTPTAMAGASPKDLERLGLTPDTALALAVRNIRRVYGAPTTVPWSGLQQVKGKSPDLDSSYFLDKDFWNAQLKQHPEGLVAMVPKRGGLVFAPLSGVKAVQGMTRGVAYLHTSSERLRISSALYLFRDGKWRVFQPAVTSGQADAPK